MASLSAAEIHGLANVCGPGAADLIAAAVAASAVPGVFDSINGATQIGTNTTDVNTIVGLLKVQATNAVTAFATGGQASAVALTSNFNRLGTVATAGDSVKLKAAAAGHWQVVINDGAAAAQVFGAGTDTINSIATATGVTLPAGSVAIFYATTTGNYRGVILTDTPKVNTAISTAGAGTLTAAGIVGSLITRTGASAAYTDTTDTAVAIVAAIPVVKAGMTFEFTIKNMVAFTETLAAGVGVTLAGLSVIPPLSVSRFLVTVVSVTAVTITGIDSTPLINLPVTKYATAALATGTLTAGQITGAQHVYLETTTDGAASMTTRTAAEMFGDIPNCQIGFAYKLTLINSGNNTLTLLAGANVTLTGTMTMATLTTRDFTVTFTSATACTIQGVSKGTIEAT